MVERAEPFEVLLNLLDEAEFCLEVEAEVVLASASWISVRDIVRLFVSVLAELSCHIARLVSQTLFPLSSISNFDTGNDRSNANGMFVVAYKTRQ